MRELELRERRVQELQSCGEQLLREQHPARDTIEVRGWRQGHRAADASAGGSSMSMSGVCDPCPISMSTSPQSFLAALRTQWSWMLQLCCCVETHLKENGAYFQV